MSRAWMLCISSLVALACGGPKGPTQLYPGEERRRSEVAVLYTTSNTRVVAIDGAAVSGSSWSLLPGPHEVWLHVGDSPRSPVGDPSLWRYCRATLDAQAGTEYMSLLQSRGSADTPALQLKPGIADMRGVLVAEAIGCTSQAPDAGSG